jgi:hypothetical protein
MTYWIAGTNLAIRPIAAMSGRRSYPRFSVLPSPEGVLRVMSDVVVKSVTADDMVVLSREPGVRGELIAVQPPDSAGGRLLARVLESQLIVVDGSIRHELRLHHTTGFDSPPGGTEPGLP